MDQIWPFYLFDQHDQRKTTNILWPFTWFVDNKTVDSTEKSARFFNDTTWKIVQTEIKNGLENNLTTEQMAQELWQSLIDRAPWEARRIAATEMTRTEGFGTHEGYKQNDQVDMQGWSCSMLATSRDDHVAADGQEVGIDEDFKIGGYPMAYPGDERAPAGEVCNCRCSTYPVVGAL